MNADHAVVCFDAITPDVVIGAKIVIIFIKCGETQIFVKVDITQPQCDGCIKTIGGRHIVNVIGL